MAGTGGVRAGAGRKPKAEELKTSELARKALIAKYGSIDASFQSLLDSGEPALIKFVHEHAFGKPTEKVEHSGSTSISINWAETKTYEAKH
jgi:hypothetical protein